MIGIFELLMWYLLLVLYMGQVKGVFGTYEPITYKTGCALWGIFPVIGGALIVRAAKRPTRSLIISAMALNIFCMVITIIAIILTIIELSSFNTVSYRNYGQAKLGREVSRLLLTFYPLECVIALIYSIFSCMNLGQRREDTVTSVADEVMSNY
uniref:Membrane spanning 4-domains A13 n=2 Tax=Microcebus murinus TaxID=30608 RepID=A0A8C5VB17_MICMU